ncbi:GTP pyrophosphokinase, (p)ppGpp synthetase II / Guanosine-3',5'-bis(diphosphate) 3'-pyrophosphohydrolase [Candidatus Palibaumannia cicadellinicola]|uniref:GTP pyrophosphokinase, (P)ppGpp synthetase II / Guanosine-3',5'-bis(Diphosphate) 3'-pyrophosphohydrolase n=1 Tax=Candidatus Palibaumannia cicadellinicola TaxID=186490 RepID=A0A088MXC0_9GAMM|nr:GTP pyrophosphokinase, (p)ppGpp synthetase II / Guanosine-3',5'-bis(diphosphate) 3'-pyrophosphohydrolase [Candidatus Baumannia cicadellinicola]
MCFFENLNLLIQSYLPEDQIKQLRQAYLFARDAHEGQTRSSGEPYITHPVAVACILAEMRLDYETLMGALLHDVIEDTPATYQDMKKLFGKSVAELVEGVSKLDHLKFRNKKEAQAENFRKMIMAMLQDIRVVLIKLTDRTHNMRTLNALRPDKRRRIALETLEIYSPLANRLGIHYLKTELEELGFEAVYPNHYRVIKDVVKTARSNNYDLIQTILAEIEGRLTDAGIRCRVSGREKHLYSIYCKMHQKEQCLHSIIDFYAFLVIVNEVDTCYRVLGQMHSLYKPRPGLVKDYIAIPKTNGYQSLHTSMIGPHNLPVEVQIRTEDMDLIAEMGVAAHWAYKEQGETETTTQISTQRWMQSLLELQQSTDNSFEFIKSVKSDLFPQEISLLTPEEPLVELPTGLIPVDFAYPVHIHTNISSFRLKVDRQHHQLSQLFSNNYQIVEIITSLGMQPNFIVSSKGCANISQMLKQINWLYIPVDNLQLEMNYMKLSILEGLLANKYYITRTLQTTISSKSTENVFLIFAKCCRRIL